MSESVESLNSRESLSAGGRTLADLLVHQKRLTFSTVVDYLDQLSEAIDLAHERGYIHRNIQPSTILLTAEGHVVLLGLRSSGGHKSLRSYQQEIQATSYEAPSLMALPYMAPEKILEGDLLSSEARNISNIAGMNRAVDGRADLYSLGVVLYQMVTGELPFRAETPEQVALQHLRMPPPSPRQLRPDLPVAAEQAMLRSLAKRPADRYIHAQDLATAFRVALIAADIPLSPLPATNTTPSLQPAVSAAPLQPAFQESQVMPTLSNFQRGNTGTLKLTGPAKIVQVPVAGQPGLYVTGLLPVFPQQPSPGETLALTPMTKGDRSKRMAIFALVMVVLLVLFGSGIFWFVHTHSGQITTQSTTVATVSAGDLKATATAQAMATADANIILVDPLSQNIHNWPLATTGSMLYIFEDNAYHITDNDSKQGAPAILPDELLQGSFAYSLTMEEIKGDDTSINNEFGMIIRANSQNKNGKIVTTFYSFEVLNNKGGEYQFWKYDDSQGSSVSPWTKLWHHPFGSEFHQGHGPGSINTLKMIVNGKSFTLIVNGKQIMTVQDNSCQGCPCTCSGGVGMLVNLKGTEVAFSNLKLTYN